MLLQRRDRRSPGLNLLGCRIANEVCKRIDYFFQSSHTEIREVIRPSTHIADVFGSTEHALSNNGDQSVVEAARATQFAAGQGVSRGTFRFAKSQTRLLDESNRHRVAIEFSIARLDGGDDDKDRVQHPKDGQKKEADQDQAKDRGDGVVDEHRDLEVD